MGSRERTIALGQSPGVAVPITPVDYDGMDVLGPWVRKTAGHLTDSFSLIRTLSSVGVVRVGLTLFTVMVVVLLPVPPSSSVTVARIVFISDEVPVGLSSRYTCDREKLRAPIANEKVSTRVPSPQSMDTVWVSAVPGSVNVPEMATDSFSLIVRGVAVKPVTTGATFVTLTHVLSSSGSPSLSVTFKPIGYVPSSTPW